MFTEILVHSGLSRSVLEYKFFTFAIMNCPLNFDNTLFKRQFIVVRFALFVDTSPLYYNLSLTTVMWHILAFYFYVL